MIGKVKSVTQFSGYILKNCPEGTERRAKTEDEVYLVFLNDKGRTVGAVSLEYFGFSIPKNYIAPVWDIFIPSFEVLEKYRGKGYGKEMVGWIENNLPCKLISLHHRAVEADGGASLHFWEHLGYKVSDPYNNLMEKVIRK